MQLETAGSNDFGPCECCGHMSRKVWGSVHDGPRTVATYFVQWTLGRVAEEGAHFDLVVGDWGEGATRADRVAVSLELRWLPKGPSFMVIDAATRPVSSSELVGRALLRSEVIGRPIAEQVFGLVDLVWLTDERITEVSRAGGRTRG